MNIFHLSVCPRKSASYLCDKHVSKMFTETGQMLSTVHRQHGENHDGLYEIAHPHHPMTKWCGLTSGNYRWAYAHMCELMSQHWLRYNTTHKTMYRMCHLTEPPPKIREGGFTLPPLCMPDKYKSKSHVASYRMYYCKEKSHFAKWVKGQPVPFWYDAIS
jgi:hypothetical protein